MVNDSDVKKGDFPEQSYVLAAWLAVRHKFKSNGLQIYKLEVR